ncbi:hypothetical protein N7492_007386 [Penicillium capsulatum]|uniref:DNA endonuclease activator Ctp1 C-terminal domain-containing protein n=1 Tax=Penicillium capsulatum TaxID=69766 RepID=A0A9W9I172_9EURO|nr:hypothetical protein N7492_007386 [Penicillium capsulatum]KAJ6117226.1 hypothetical protein N7512_006951 [Penicillium capsulatum]
MDSSTRPILSPSKVLHPVSPERMNQQGIPASPSLPADLLSLHHKNTKGVSEVQAKVAFLNGLSRGGSPVHSSNANNAAVQRAVLGREEAESALASAQEELSEAQSRERRISERLESLLEELHGTKERQAHERSIFEKEIRKARKEAFRAGSTLVKLQEELKHSKSESKALQEEVAAERHAKDKAKQEAFERAYTLAGLTEELQVLKGKLQSMETTHHSNTLEIRAHEIRKEDFGRLSLAEGDLAFLSTPRRPKRVAPDSVMSPAPELEAGDAVQHTPPKRQRLSEVTSPVDGQLETAAASDLDYEAMEELKDELGFERRRREEAEEMVHFLNVECQFQRCSCRIAEREGRRYIYDTDYFEKFQKPQLEAEAEAEAEAARQASPQHPAPQSSHTPSVEPPAPVPHNEHVVVKPEPGEPPERMPMPAEPLVTFSPETGTFKTFPSPLRDNVRPRRTDEFTGPQLTSPQAHSHQEWMHSPNTRGRHVKSYTPSGDPIPAQMPRATPFESISSERSIAPAPREAGSHMKHAENEAQRHEISTMKRLPLRDPVNSQRSSGLIPDTPINREEALAQIRARRGRARSKQRSVSANEAASRASGASVSSSATTPGRGPRRIPNLRADGRAEIDVAERRDLSAPVRMFRR